MMADPAGPASPGSDGLPLELACPLCNKLLNLY